MADIAPGTADLRLGDSAEFRLDGLSKDQQAALSWSLEPSDAGRVHVTSKSSCKVELSTEPVSKTVTLRATYPSSRDPTKNAVKTATIHSVLVWKEGWPQLAKTPQDRDWNTPLGRRAAQILYGVFAELERKGCSVVSGAGPVPMFWTADTSLADKGGQYHPFWAFIQFGDNTINSLLDPSTTSDPKALLTTNSKERWLAQSIVHELGHAIMANRCSWDPFQMFSKLVEALFLVANALAGLTPAVLPALAVDFVVGPLCEWVFGRKPSDDFMSDFCRATDWVVKDPGMMAGLDGLLFIPPILGSLLRHVVPEVAPNYLTANDPSREWLGLRNTRLDWERFKPLLKNPPLEPWPVDGHVAPRIDALLDQADLITAYGATNPAEDWGETLRTYAFGAAEGAKQGGAPNQPVVPGSKREKFLLDNGLFPQGWTPLDVPDDLDPKADGSDKDPRRNTWARYLDWKIDVKATPLSPRKYSNADLAAARALMDPSISGLVERNREVMTSMALPPRSPSFLEVLRTAELHGSGLRLCGERDDGKALENSSKGDLVFAHGGDAFVALSVNDAGVPTHLLGQPQGGMEFTSEGPAKAYQALNLTYTWTPDAGRRRWDDGGAELSPHYRDLDAALVNVTRLWGESEDSDGKDVTTASGFLRALLKPGGFDTSELTDDTYRLDALAFCATRGEGWQEHEPGQTRLRVGDVVLLTDGRLGVVSRSNSAGDPCTVIASGKADRAGRVGEDARSIHVLHDVHSSRVSRFWVPTDALREF